MSFGSPKSDFWGFLTEFDGLSLSVQGRGSRMCSVKRDPAGLFGFSSSILHARDLFVSAAGFMSRFLHTGWARLSRFWTRSTKKPHYYGVWHRVILIATPV